MRHGYRAYSYHAGMKAEERQAVQDHFMASDSNIIVATIAFGMGIDKANIRYIYHFDPPKTPRATARKSVAQGTTVSVRTANSCCAPRTSCPWRTSPMATPPVGSAWPG